MNRNLHVINFGKKEFSDFYKLNYRMWLQRVANDISDTIIFVEHPHVILVGKAGNVKEIMIPSALNRREEIPVYEVDWDGSSTYRGPGQLVIYPIVHLSRHGIKEEEFKKKVEDVLIRLLSKYGIKGEPRPGENGVWVAGHKIASIGIEVCQQVTRHSISLNVNPRLSLFRMLQSSGGATPQVTSMYHLLKKKIDTKVLKIQFADLFQNEFGLKAEIISS